MKSLQKLTTICCLCLSSLMVQGQIIDVKENDRGTIRPISITDKQIVDINSRLEVDISKTKLLKAIREQFPQYSDQIDLDEKLLALDQALSNQETILNILQQKVVSIESQDDFFRLMDEFLITIQGNTFLSNRYEVLSEDYFGPSNDGAGNMEAYIFSKFNDDILRLKEEFSLLESESFQINLVAFKKDKFGGDRVHIENFDTYTEREYVTIKRWVTTLNEDQKKELDRLGTKSKGK